MSKERLGSCLSCGGLVPELDGPPYKGHKKGCQLVAEWRQEEETIRQLEEKLAAVKKQCEEFGVRGDVACAKCGKDLGFGWDAIEHERTLLGDFKVVLCVECVNAWHEHIKEECTTDWEAIRVLDNKIDATRLCFMTAGGENVDAAFGSLEPLNEQRRALKDKFYDYAKAWAADNVSAPAP